MKRQIVKIDEEKCNGCGLCIPSCPEGALQIVNGKARLVREPLCDGLGACIGHCPEGALTVEEREAEAHDERTVVEQVIQQGADVIQEHLRHLREHNEHENLRIAQSVLKEKGLSNGEHLHPVPHGLGGCPGAKSVQFARPGGGQGASAGGGAPASQLTHWPIQLHLISPRAGHCHRADLLLAADCTAFAIGDFHPNHLRSKTLAVACPKLDQGQEIYLQKLTALIEEAQINTLTVMTMEVPCCGGLLQLARQAASRASGKVPVKHIVVSLQGDVLHEEWI